MPMLRAALPMDLMYAIDGGYAGTWVHVGVRDGGEKQHESLVSDTEAVRALDIGWAFVIEPNWNMPAEREPWAGVKLAEGITSDRVQRMTYDELRAAIAAVPEE